MPKHILAYTDSKTLGGHELMALKGLAALAGQSTYQITLAYPVENHGLAAEVARLTAQGIPLKILTVARKHGVLRSYRHRFPSPLTRLLRQQSPDLVLALQGNTEIASAALFAARQANIPCASYIPLAQPLGEIGARLTPYRRWVNERVINQPDAWITLAPKMETQLRKRGAQQPVHLVPNGIDTKQLAPLDKAVARQKLGLPNGVSIIAQIGRITFHHKGHSFLLESLAQSSLESPLRKAHLLFVGEGPDQQKLIEQLESSPWKKQYTYLPWAQDLSPHYAAADLLALPSFFEGVPLVMLEAMWTRLPIAAANCGAIADYLPAEWLFSPGEKQGCIQSIEKLLQPTQALSAQLESNQQRISNDSTLQHFEAHFAKAIASLLSSSTPD